MTVKLTKKDEKLLIFLGCVLLFTLTFMFFIKPGMETSEELSDQIVTAELAKDEMDQKISQIPILQQTNTTQKTKWDEESSRFYDEMESQEIDRLLTQLLLDQNISIEQLTISSQPDVSILQNYRPYSTDSGDTATMVYTAILYSGASFEVYGEKDKLADLVDKLSNDYPSIRVRSYTYADSSNSRKGTRLSMALEVYMRDGQTSLKTEEDQDEDAAQESGTNQDSIDNIGSNIQDRNSKIDDSANH